MTEFTMDRLRENLEALKMKNTLEILECEACPWVQLPGTGGGGES